MKPVKYLMCLSLTIMVVLWSPGSAAFAQNFADLKKDQAKERADATEDADMKAALAATDATGIMAADDKNYTLGKTDMIEITVMRHPEVSNQYEINSEGKIQYEFVGDIFVAGLTKDQVAKLVAERLKDYIVNPEVTVKIIGYNSKVVYVVGEVASPGKIAMRGNTITVREALMQAGLPMLTGITKKSRLITPSESGKVSNKRVDVYALLYEGDLRQNYVMHPGDVLYIPPTFLTKTIRAIVPVTAPITNTAGAAGQVYGF